VDTQRDATATEVKDLGNRNQQHAAARIFLELKASSGTMPSMSYLEREHSISRRTLQRARAKLARLGLIEHVGFRVCGT